MKLLSQVLSSSMLKHLVGAFALTDAALCELEHCIVDILLSRVVAAGKLCQQPVKLTIAILFVVVRHKHMVHNFVQKGRFNRLKFWCYSA